MLVDLTRKLCWEIQKLNWEKKDVNNPTCFDEKTPPKKGVNKTASSNKSDKHELISLVEAIMNVTQFIME